MSDPGAQAKPSPSAHLITASFARWSEQGAQHWLPVVGQSMWPFLLDGDRVLVQCGDGLRRGERLRRGDVLVFWQGNRLLIHRLIALPAPPGAPDFVTCGDNLRRPDPPVAAAAILGRVIRVQRGHHQCNLQQAHWRGLGWIVAHLQSLYLHARGRL